MSDETTTMRATLLRIMAEPVPADLWLLGKELLVIDSEPARQARSVARAFHACLRGLESKSSSRSASRWGAALGTAAVASVSAQDLAGEHEDPLRRLLQSGVPALLEVGSAIKSAQAWEVEADLVYDDLAWFLYDELWQVSASTDSGLSAGQRRDRIDQVLDPLLDVSTADGDRAALVVHVFQAVLAARMLRLLDA
jgi:hypothetical protein